MELLGGLGALLRVGALVLVGSAECLSVRSSEIDISICVLKAQNYRQFFTYASWRFGCFAARLCSGLGWLGGVFVVYSAEIGILMGVLKA